MNILCVGKTSYSKIFKMDHFIKENSIYEVDDINKIEGIAYNVAYLLGKFGKNVYLVGVLGNDEIGLSIKKELDNIKVDTSYLKLDNNIKTQSNIIIDNSENDSKTILSYNLNERHNSSIDVNIKPDVVLIDGSECELSNTLIEEKDAVSIMTIDTYSDTSFELSKKADFVICDFTFVNKILQRNIEDDLEDSYLKLKQYFKNIIIILKNKSCLYEYNGQIKVLPSIDDNTNKANDIFYGAFIYAIVSNYDYEDSIMFANVALGLSKDKYGIDSNIDLKQLESKYHEYR